MFYLATRDVRQGAKFAKQGATQFRKNIKTMREWAEEGAEKYAVFQRSDIDHRQINLHRCVR